MMRFPTLVVAACLCAHTASAATFCANSSAELQNALTSAASNNQDDVIRIAAGNYSVIGSNRFEFLPAASDQDNDLQIIGGWTFFFENVCGQLLLDDASLTVLDGNNAARVLRLFPPETGDVTIRNLTFTNGAANDTIGGGALLILPLGGDTYNAAMTIENNIFLSNSSPSSGALRLTLSGGSTIAVRLLNNMFVGNEATGLGRGAATISGVTAATT
jgi:hypothetical protein